MLDWNVAVYCANEAARLKACLQSVTAALDGMAYRVTVIVNGSRDDSLAIARDFAHAEPNVEIFEIIQGDKSNAINAFYYQLRSPARFYAGVDGYVTVAAAAFQAMGQLLETDTHANAVSGVAMNGRTMSQATAQTLQTGGQLHGQLHALRAEFIDRMVARGIRLPVGLYRGDGLLGSMAAHNLDPVCTAWDNARIPGAAAAGYEIPVLSLVRGADWRRQFRRSIRQRRGVLENAAIKSIIYASGYEALPGDANVMIRRYLEQFGAPRPALQQMLFQYLALREVSRPGFDPAKLAPKSVF